MKREEEMKSVETIQTRNVRISSFSSLVNFLTISINLLSQALNFSEKSFFTGILTAPLKLTY